MPEQPATLAAALVLLQSRLPRITKDDEAQAGSRTYRYANLASIHDAILPLLGELGLYWTCCPTLMDGQLVLDYALTHVAGPSIGGQYPLPSSGTPQQIGSAITYARRYTLTAVLGIAPAEDDDDGHAAEQAAKPSYEERVAAGRMNRAQVRDHNKLRQLDHPRPAERATGTAGEETDWTTGPPEDAPGSITQAQLTRMHYGFTKAGITDRDDRLAFTMSVLDLPELESSKELSMSQASRLIGRLEASDG